MGLFTRFFQRKDREQEELNELWDEIVYNRDEINLKNEEERTKYLESCLDQIADASKEMELLNGEYHMVTKYLTDMEEIELLPEEKRNQLEELAVKIIKNESERKSYLDRKDRMEESKYRQMQNQQEEVEEGIRKMEETEKYQQLIKQDLKRLDNEKNAFRYRMEDLEQILANLKGISTILLVALGICFLMLLVLQYGFRLNAKIGYIFTAGMAVIAVAVIFYRFSSCKMELEKVTKSYQRLIQLQNTVKIRYVNNTNLLDYYYLKYKVGNSKELQRMWEAYQKEREERKKYQKAEHSIEFAREDLLTSLRECHIKDAERFIHEPGAIADKKEMVELRHGYILRRQNLRKQMEYNRDVAQTAKKEIVDIAGRYPQYAAQIQEMVDRYEKKYKLTAEDATW